MKKAIAFSFDDYLRHYSSQRYEELPITGIGDIDYLLKNMSLFSSNVPFILDYRTRSYIHFGPSARSTVGHPAEAFYEGGWEFTHKIWNPSDFKVFKDSIFKDNLSLLGRSTAEYSHHRTSYTFRVKDFTGKWIYILQQSTLVYFPNETLPSISFGTVTDISSFKKNSRITHKIEKLSEEGFWIPILVKNYFPDISAENLLSKTETEILKRIIDGYTSRELSDMFHRSIHTIKTHRKNILEKTNCRNIAELLTYAMENGLL